MFWIAVTAAALTCAFNFTVKGIFKNYQIKIFENFAVAGLFRKYGKKIEVEGANIFKLIGAILACFNMNFWAKENIN